MVIQSGDLDYQGKASEFFHQIDAVLGKDFPYFVGMGNYENKAKDTWEAYAQLQMQRLNRNKGLFCPMAKKKELACVYRGVSFVTSPIGVNSSRLGVDLHALKQHQEMLWGGVDNNKGWRFCSWHLPMARNQVGYRQGVPWMASPELLEAHESCRRRGAIILTGHEHYFARTHTILRFSNEDVEYKHVSAQVAPFKKRMDILEISHNR